MSTTTSAAATPQSRTPRYELLTAGLLLLFASAWFFHGAVSSYFQQLKAHQIFVPVSAVVIDAKVETRGSPASTHGASFYPRVIYRYEVDGRAYESSRYFFAGLGWADHSSAQAQIERFSKGAAVQAYVDPENPSESVLERSKPSAQLFLLAAPLSAFGLLIVFFSARGRRGR